MTDAIKAQMPALGGIGWLASSTIGPRIFLAPEGAGGGDGGEGGGDGSGDGGSEGDGAGKGAEGEGAAKGAAGEGDGSGKDGAGDEGDGGKAADWRAPITDKSLREFADRFTSPADLAKAAFDLRKANGAMIKVPGKDASEEDVAKFRKALGVPEAKDGYQFEMPEGAEPTDVDKAFQGKMAEVFHATGVPAETAKQLNKAWNEMTAAAEAEAARIAKQGFEDAQATLKKEMGADYEPSKQVANRALQAFGGDDLVTFLQETVVNGHRLSDHPAIFKAFATVGRRMGESDFIGAVSQDEKSTIQGEIDQLMRDNPPGTAKYNDPKVQKRIREFSEQLHGTGAIVGSGGRAN